MAEPTFAEAFRFWLKLGFISFGGPTGQIAIMHTELVDRKQWISEDRFLHALNYCMLLPGPEAQQLAIYCGWLLHRAPGGICAGALFVIPSMFLLYLLSYVYVVFGKVFWVASFFNGLKPAVVAIVAIAVIRIARKALKKRIHYAIAAGAFIALYFLRAPFPAIIALAGLLGYVLHRFGKGVTFAEQSKTVQHLDHVAPSLRRALIVILVCCSLWAAPILAVAGLLGTEHTLFKQAIFFSKAAMVTFGGAYAILPYVAQQAVQHYGWLNAGQMIDGLGLAETTPGPLIMVLQFVGFLGGWNQPGGLPPLLAATLGALITTWVTFIPCFLWIFLGAPHIEQWRGRVALNSILTAVTAAVVGVVLNLAVWFSLHALFPMNHPDYIAILMAVIAFAGMLRWKWDLVPVVLVSGLLGILRGLLL